MRSEGMIMYETLNRNARKAAQPRHIALPTCTLQSSIGSELFLRSWLISHSRFRTNRFFPVENLQVRTFVSNFLMNSDHLAGGTIRMSVCTTCQCCRSARTIVEREIPISQWGILFSPHTKVDLNVIWMSKRSKPSAPPESWATLIELKLSPENVNTTRVTTDFGLQHLQEKWAFSSITYVGQTQMDDTSLVKKGSPLRFHFSC